MKRLLLLLSFATLLGACATAPKPAYKVTAYKPKDPASVRVKVSTSTQNVYVVEGDRLLMAVQGCVGANNATPQGNFTILDKIKKKRRVSNPDAGYPMAYWCEFQSAYGFHEGFVHPAPRTHGCIRLHREAAARLYELVRVGTPVNIARTQPEDAKYGASVRKLDESQLPDPSRELLHSERWFQDPAGPLLIEQ